MGPLLLRLGVHTYRDLLTIDLDLIATSRGVGKRKRTILRSLKAEAGSLVANGQPRGLAVVDAVAPVPDASGDNHEAEVVRPLDPLDEQLDPPPGMEPLLRRLEVFSYRDALDIDLDLVATMRGVGSRKQAVLRSLKAEARARVTDVDPAVSGEFPAPGAVHRRVAASPRPHDGLGIHEALGRFSTRAARAIEAAGLRTIGDLRDWLEGVETIALGGVGVGTIAAIRRRLVELADRGPAELVFGGPEPADVQTFAERFLERFDGKTCEILTRRLRDGATLDAVGSVFGITRERVRQIVDKHVEADRPSWAPRARALLAPVFDLLEARGGVALSSRVFRELGEPEPWALDFALLMAGQALHRDDERGVTASGEPEASRALRLRLERLVIDAVERTAAASEVRAVLRAEGLDGPDHELDELAARWLGVQVHGIAVGHATRPVQGLCARVLIEAKQPLTADAIIRNAQRIDPSWRVTRNAVASALGRMDRVYSHSHGYWVHEAALQIERAQIDHFAQLCLPEVRASGGQAVSCFLLLQRLREAGHALQDLTAHILRDALLRTGEVRSWRSGADVAWKGGDVRRKSIADWISEVASERDEPFSAHDLAEEIAERSGFSAASVIAQFPQQAELMSCGPGRYLLSSVSGLDDRTLREGAADVFDALPAGEVWTAPRLAPRLPRFASLVRRLGPGVLWGFARLHDAVTVRSSSSMMWRSESGATFWEVVGEGLLRRYPVIGVASLAEALRDTCGELPPAVRQRLCAEGHAAGRLLRIGRGFYLDARLSHDERIDAIESDERALTYVLGELELDAEPAARGLLDDVRERFGL